MTHRIILIFSLLTTLGWAQQKKVSLAGSRISLIPPANTKVFNQSSSIVGANYKMTLVEIPNTDGLAKFDGADSSLYSNAGVAVIDQINSEIDGYKSKIIYFNSDQGISFVQFILVGDEFYVIGSTQLEMGDTLAYQNVVTSLKSIEIDEEKSIVWNDFFAFNLVEDNPFHLETEGCSPMQLVFTKDEATVSPNASSTKPFIICKQEPRNESVSLLDQFISNSVSPLLGKELNIRNVVKDEKTMMDGIEVYELIADCELKGVSFRLYCVATLLDEVSVFLYGQSYNVEDHSEIALFMSGLTFKK